MPEYTVQIDNPAKVIAAVKCAGGINVNEAGNVVRRDGETIIPDDKVIEYYLRQQINRITARNEYRKQRPTYNEDETVATEVAR